MTQSAWEATPWMIGGGIKHSVNVGRLVAYAAFGGQEGIVSPRDLQVRERAVPDDKVRIAPGACSVLVRNPAINYEAYAARLPLEDVVGISPTGSGAWRTDLIVARVENPYMSNEPYVAPTQEEIAAGAARFIRTHVYPGIKSGSNGSPEHPTASEIRARIGNDSALALATVAIPASTGTIAQAFIKDQRSLAQFRETQTMRVVNPDGQITLNGTNWIDLITTQVAIPNWATHWSASGMLGGITRKSGNLKGSARVELGTAVGRSTTVDDGATQTDRIIMMAGDSEVAIPVAERGTTQKLALRFSRTSGLTDTTVNGGSSGRLDITFHSKPESI